MDVRQVRPTDAPLVLALALDVGCHLIKHAEWPAGNPVLHTVVQSVLPLALPGRAWIARDRESVALLEARPRRYVLGWDITRLVVRGDPEAVVPGTVATAIRHVQSRGVPRLFARSTEGGGEALKQLEFQVLAREYVLVGPGRPVSTDAPLPEESRYRMPTDAWPLHQLETQITPAAIRQLEGMTSVDWSIPRRNLSEIVVERDGHIDGWIAWTPRSRRRVGRMAMMVHPDHPDLAADLVEHVLAQLPPGGQITARLREYQTEALAALFDAGFSVVAEEIVMVKHARVVPARAKRRLIKATQVATMQPFHSQHVASGHDGANVM